MNRFLLIILLLILFIECKNSTKQVTINEPAIDTTRSFKINSIWVTPKHTLEFNALIKAAKDTLELSICSEFVYSPFGIIKNKNELKNSNLKNFEIKDRIDTLVDGISEIQILNLKSSKIILFFDDDPEAVKSSYIVKGEIFDKDVTINDSISIGMAKKNFINTFFDSFPNQLLDKFNVIVLETCVTGTNHVYDFKNDILTSVRFDCIECDWNLDY
jgi:hypothetical protein